MLQVSSDFMLILATLFSSAWKIATSFTIPGTNVSVPSFMLAMLMIFFVLRHVPKLLGISDLIDKGNDSSK